MTLSVESFNQSKINLPADNEDFFEDMAIYKHDKKYDNKVGR